MIISKLPNALRFVAVLAAICVIPKTVDADWYLDSIFEPESNLAVYDGGGTGSVNYSAVQEGVRADFGFSGVPINYVFQSWDGTSWPNPIISDFQESPDFLASAQADIEHFEATDEIPFSMGASIGGEFFGGLSMAAGAALDLTVEVDPNTLAVVEVFDAFAEVDGTTGADGIGFAGIRLYDPTVGLNDPGGVNNPFASEFVFQSSGDSAGEFLSFFVEFDNLNGDSTFVQELRLEAYTVVFTNAVPEPSSIATLALFGCFAVSRRRRKV